MIRGSNVLTGAINWLFAVVAIVVWPILAFVWFELYVEQMSALPIVLQSSETVISDPDRPGGLVEIGHRELGQTRGPDSAEERHLAILFSNDEPVAMANIARFRRLSLNYRKASVNSNEHLIGPEDSFRIGAITYTVLRAGEGQLEIATEKDRFVLPAPFWKVGYAPPGLENWMSKNLRIGGFHVDPQAPERGFQWLRYLFQAHALKRDAPAILAGNSDIRTASVEVRYDKNLGLYRLKSGAGVFAAVCPRDQACFELGRAFWPLEHPKLGLLKSVVIGKTRYSVVRREQKLVLQTTSRPHWLSVEQQEKSDHIVLNLGESFNRGLDASRVGSGLIVSFLSVFTALSAISYVFAAFVLTITFLRTSWTRTMEMAALMAVFALFSTAAGPSLKSLSAGTLDASATLALAVAFFRPSQLALRAGRKKWFKWRGYWTSEVARFRVGESVFLGTEVMIAGMAVLWIVMLKEPAPIGDSSAELFRAMVALIILYTITGLIIAWRNQKPLALVFWFFLTITVALGMLSAAQHVFGHRFGIHLTLFQRHLATLALIAFFACTMTMMPTDRASRIMRAQLNLLQRERYANLVSFLLWVIAALLALCAWVLLEFVSPGVSISAELGLFIPSWLLSAFFGLLSFFLIYLDRRWRNLRRRSGGKWRRLPLPSPLISIVSVMLGIVLFVTPERGLLGLQPSEAGKTWICLLLALLIAIYIENRVWKLPHERRQKIVWPLAFFILVTGLFAAGSAINSDLSPIAIIVFASLTIIATIATVATFRLVRLPVFLISLLGLSLFLVERDVITAQVAAWLFVAAVLVRFAVGAEQGHRELLTMRIVRRAWYRGAQTYLRARRNWRSSPFTRKAIAPGMAVVAAAFILAGYGAKNWLSEDFQSLTDARKLETFQARLIGKLPNTVQERFLSWQDANLYRPLDQQGALIVEHPDLSLQVRESREVIAASGCGFVARADRALVSVADRLGLGLSGPTLHQFVGTYFAGFCDGNGDAILPRAGNVMPFVLAVPAIQDDFSATFLVAALGRDAALVLLIAQIGLVTTMWVIAAANALVGFETRSARGLSTFSALFVATAGLVMFSQFALAWSNALGLAPVVGQPMTFVSFAGSHHLFFATPTVLITLGAALLVQTSQNARKSLRHISTGREVRFRSYSGLPEGQ